MELATEKIENYFISIISELIDNYKKDNITDLENGSEDSDPEDLKHAEVLKSFLVNEIKEDSIFLQDIELKIKDHLFYDKPANFFGQLTNKVSTKLKDFYHGIIHGGNFVNFVNSFLKTKAKNIDEIGRLFIYTVLSTLHSMINNPNFKLNFQEINRKFDLTHELYRSTRFYLENPETLDTVKYNPDKNIDEYHNFMNILKKNNKIDIQEEVVKLAKQKYNKATEEFYGENSQKLLNKQKILENTKKDFPIFELNN